MTEPRLRYYPREDATPEGELAVLAAVYRYLLDRHEKNAIEANEEGRAGAECVGDRSGKRLARDGSSKSRKRR